MMSEPDYISSNRPILNLRQSLLEGLPRTWIRIALGAVIALAMIPEASAQRSLQDAENVIVMIEATVSGSDEQLPEFGAGIIIGMQYGRVYIATAKHLLRDTQDVRDSVSVEFRMLPGERFFAREIEADIFDSDLAVLLVRDGPTNVLRDALETQILREDVPLRGDEIYHIGQPNSIDWESNATPGRVQQVTDQNLVFESPSITVGYSGGGLFDSEYRLLGMVTKGISPVEAQAIPIRLIAQIMENKGYPVSLYPIDDPVTTETTTTCDVEVRTEPMPADVYIDERSVGQSPVRVSLQQGESRSIRVEKEGFESATDAISCSDSTINVNLTRIPADIILAYTGDPWNCSPNVTFEIGGRTVIPVGPQYRVEDLYVGEIDYNVSGYIVCPYYGACQAFGRGTINIEDEDLFTVVWQRSQQSGMCQVRLMSQ